MISPLARRVARVIRRRGLWADPDRVAVAVSGGADSVALTLALAELAPHAGWTLAGLIHVNHHLRGRESDEDEAFCRALARALGLSIEAEAVDVDGYRRRTRLSVEAAARTLRYEAIDRAADRLAATVVATAHTMDDQAETVLLRLLRGSTARGLSAIRPSRGRVRRPFLDVRRADVVAYLTARGAAHREDRSNLDPSVPRNRLRRDVLPLLEEHWPGGVAALARLAEQSAEDEATLSRQADEAAGRVTRSVPGGVQLDRRLLDGLPSAIARRVVRDAIEAAGGRPSTRAIEAVLGASRAPKAPSVLHLRAVRAQVTPDALTVVGCKADTPERTAVFARPMEIPGQTAVPETGIVVEASLSISDWPSGGASAMVGNLQADVLAMPLTIRSRRPGDRLQPLGAPGRRKLQDVLVDRKIPRGERDRVPIVEDARGRIVWVGGVAVAEEARVTRPEAGVVILRITKDNT